jgi:hypothetical protein
MLDEVVHCGRWWAFHYGARPVRRATASEVSAVTAAEATAGADDPMLMS